MERIDANTKYFFPKSFFYNLFDLLGENATLFIAEYNNNPIAASVFLNDHDFVHYYLSGSNPDFRNLCSTNLILYEAIIWAKAEGYKIFELGGGYKAGDSLYKFKSSFSSTTEIFYIYKKIHKQELYDLLCDLKAKYEGIDVSDLMTSGYFPAYRK
ncbi:lipid II:glycine glycyltransferase (peptidoglycan interpeptide bridge formation enzyme) [Methanohalophilus levihalophilus]|nr:lipid II:glycine glycyltransferase (peptidoglycan interpeptide bridge formation enzyme) [Methanohalophilus levihalophilus]